MSSYRLMFPGVRSSLMFSGFGLKPPAFGFQSYSYSSLKTSPSPFRDNGLLFSVRDVLCQPSELVLWNLLSIQMFFQWIFGGKVVSRSYSSTTLGLPYLVFINLSLKACKEFGSFNHKLPQFPCLASCSKTILSYFTQTRVSRFSSVPMYRDPVSTTLCSCIKILY